MSEVVIKVVENYRYQTNHSLGQGVYGKVYLGIDTNIGQKVAIKKIQLSLFTKDKYLENSIRSEIKLLQKFNHQNIIKFIDVISSKNNLYIVTQFCKDGDLKQLIKKRKTFSELQAFEIISQILYGFQELVKEKIIHRDLKPANILIDNGKYKIADFGFARYVDNFGTQMLKSLVGSPIYMAPQILQHQQYTTKCDIWSIGVIFYELVVGRHPWTGRDQHDLLRSIQNISITSLLKRQLTMSTKACEFLKKCLTFRQQNRASWKQLFQMYLMKNIVSKSPQKSKIQPQQYLYKDSNKLIQNPILIKPINSNSTTASDILSPTRISNKNIIFNKQVCLSNKQTNTIKNHQISNDLQYLILNKELNKNSENKLIKQVQQTGGICQYNLSARKKQINLHKQFNNQIQTVNKKTNQNISFQQIQILKRETAPLMRQNNINKQKQSPLKSNRDVINKQPASRIITNNRQFLINRQPHDFTNIRSIPNAKQISPIKKEFYTNKQFRLNQQASKSPIFSSLSFEGLKSLKQNNLHKYHLMEQLLLINRPQFFDPYKCDKLLFLLVHSIRLKSVYTMSLINIAIKNNTIVEDIASSALKDHKIYEQAQNYVIEICFKHIDKIKQQIETSNEFQTINLQRIKKIQKFVMEISIDLLKKLIGQLRRRQNQNFIELLSVLIKLVSNQTNNTSQQLINVKQRLKRLIQKGQQLCY